jgi:lipopolysaccharide/colanic/teichoic acid biosynthesis glycosyltransferase
VSKRCLDFVLAFLGLVLLSPILLTISLLILVSMGRPVFFKQNRVGKLDSEFTLVKFRTMVEPKGSQARQFEPGNERHISPLGKVLRRTKLDELPQLLNVLKGDMSLVGPRPEVREWVSVYPERWAFIHSVQPGITDPASLAYRDEERMLTNAPDAKKLYGEIILPHKLSLYEEYIKKRSLSSDIKIICKTIFLSLLRFE